MGGLLDDCALIGLDPRVGGQPPQLVAVELKLLVIKKPRDEVETLAGMRGKVIGRDRTGAPRPDGGVYSLDEPRAGCARRVGIRHCAGQGLCGGAGRGRAVPGVPDDQWVDPALVVHLLAGDRRVEHADRAHPGGRPQLVVLVLVEEVHRARADLMGLAGLLVQQLTLTLDADHGLDVVGVPEIVHRARVDHRLVQ